jgi:hypothetical protein
MSELRLSRVSASLPSFISSIKNSLSAAHNSSATGASVTVTMADDKFILPLRPLIEKRDHPDPLPLEIAQINAQWGSFRDVSEESLRGKIEEEKSKEYTIDEEEGEGAGAELDTTERLDQLYKRRAEIIQFAM